jgi:PAS domain S-box-containing protein
MATDAAAAETPLRVLLVEDDPFDAELTVERLRASRPCRFTVVDNEAAFVRALRGGEVDIVLSDFALPGFSGTEALALTRRLAPALPFIFVSGVLGEEHVVDMLKQGATDYVVKIRMERLPLVVDRAIAEVRERRWRRDTQRALRESETLYGRVVESLQDHAVILLDADGAIRGWNTAAQKIFGHAADDVRGRRASLLFANGDAAGRAFDVQLERARTDGQALDERWLHRRDGSRFYASSVFTTVRAADGERTGFALIAQDITGRMRAAEALEATKNEAERANQAKNRFLAVLSHELRTPLTPLLAVAHLLEKRTNLPPDVARLVPMIRRNVELEARLIDDLLDLTSIERGKLALQVAPLDLHVTLRNALDMSAAEIERKRLQLSVRLDAEHTATVGDDARLQQVFWNLVRNAVKFTPDGGRVEVQTRNDGEADFVAVVRDSGIGIAPDVLPRIFGLFEQGPRHDGSGFGGLGIGLAIARALTLRHGGSLAASSDGEGRGSTFELRLPLMQPAVGLRPVVAGTLRVAATAETAHAGSELLLIEDHADVADSVRAMLEADGHRVEVASSLRAAREALAARRFDLLVCDLGLPDGSGYDVLALIDGVPAIAISGYGMESDIRRSRAAGFAAHIVKPFQPQQLHDAVSALIGSAAAPPAARFG